MITLIVSDNKSFRQDCINKVLEKSKILPIIYDDITGDIFELEQYLFPSLFSPELPIVHVKYLLSDVRNLDEVLFKKLLSSPTIFLFEEMSAPKALISSMKKEGAIVYHEESKLLNNKSSDIFSATKALIGEDKKSRWMSYHKALEDYKIEAIIGILYWKIKDTISKSSGLQKTKYQQIYKDMLDAHARAWQSGAPLEALVEKVILNI